MSMLPGSFSELVINDRINQIEKEPRTEFIRAIRDFRKARALDEEVLDQASLFMFATSAYLSGYYAPGEIYAMIEKRGDPGKGTDIEFVRFYSIIAILNGKEDHGLSFLSTHGMAGDSIRGLLFYATAERMAKKYTGAIMTYRKVLAMTADDRIRELVHFNLGRIYYQQSLFREALDQFSRALELNEGGISPRIWMGRCYLALGDREKARAVWNEVLARDGANAEAKQLLGTI
jgi:tetratricopeptide (TPR) repeat protein